jgi:hypothetical protein
MSKKAEKALAAYQKIVNKDQVTALRYSNSYAKLPYPYCPDISNQTNTCGNCSTLYRTADGSCNNLNFPWWGKSETPDKRLLPSAYDDYVTEPRTRSVHPGKYLPNARKVAMTAFQPQPTVSEFSHLMTYFGQYVDHDATLTAQATYSEPSPPRPLTQTDSANFADATRTTPTATTSPSHKEIMLTTI